MLLLFYLGKSFGISSNLSTLCSIVGTGKFVEQFNFNWRSQIWNLLFLLGVLLGGTISGKFLKGDQTAAISENTIEALNALGIATQKGTEVLPAGLFGAAAWSSLPTFLYLLAGGVLVGFGARYAGGCTSGHAITGLSNLQRPSLIAVIGFFIGGLVMTHFLLPYIIHYATA
jgi:uncharacterized membrane protein YedE/YeeE